MNGTQGFGGRDLHPIIPDRPSLFERLKRLLIGPPRDLADRHLFHRLSLVPILAWIGLGADGLSSSSYGPDEAFRTFGTHTFLVVPLAMMMAATVFVISIAYSRVIEHFPSGGGGYIVASKLLGERIGMVSGCALLVDYVLTITMSIGAAGDALFSFLPLAWHPWKLSAEACLILLLILLNLRGVKESILVLTPIFLLFLVTHLVLIVGGFVVKIPELPTAFESARVGFSAGTATLGIGGLFILLLHAYSLGGGTYTGIEAVSNGLAIMREPRVATGRRTMLYMSASLAFTASGLLICYLLWNVTAAEGKTMNAVLSERFVEVVPFGSLFVILTLIAEGALLVVAAQTGFVDGPRVLSNMAIDAWIPRRFSALSDRLVTQNGVLLMGAAALGGLIYTKGDVRQIVVMYSINVFLTFSITEFAMCRFYYGERKSQRDWKRKIPIHILGLAMCFSILLVTVLQKFLVGGWITLGVTSVTVFFCLWVKHKYRVSHVKLGALYAGLVNIGNKGGSLPGPVDPQQSTAAVMVGGYSGLGIHTMLSTFRTFPGQFRNLVFISVGVIDSGVFKGRDALGQLRDHTENELKKYVALAGEHGVPATYRVAVGTDLVDELEGLCVGVAKDFRRVVFFAGKLVFQRPRWYEPLLHNETAFAIQRRLELGGYPVVIIPARV